MTTLIWRRLILACAVPLAVGGCPAGRPTAATGPSFTQQGAGLRHVASGMVFPSTVGRLQRAAPHIYDTAGQDVSVGYNLANGDTKIAGTVYVYPAPPLTSFDSPDSVVADARARLARAEFARREKEVTHAHPGAILLQERPVTLLQDFTAIDGWQATFAFSGNFAGQHRTLRSELFVFCFVAGKWALEYRFTYPQQRAPRADIDGFMRELRAPS